MRLRIVWIGKTKHAPTAEWTAEYLRRIQRFLPAATEELSGRDPEAALLRRGENASLWLLDPGGKAMDSAEFQGWIEGRAQSSARETILAVGGTDGWSPKVLAQADGRLSLSRLTLSHELARVVLLEQIYRALAAIHHHPYPH